MHASCRGHKLAVAALLAAGAKVDIESHDGRTALHRAATWKRLGPLDQVSEHTERKPLNKNVGITWNNNCVLVQKESRLKAMRRGALEYMLKEDAMFIKPTHDCDIFAHASLGMQKAHRSGRRRTPRGRE